ncbi:MAG: PQQ-binding-like beta-propeller repeat protein [Planctomycetaceae bacterium]
MSDRRRIVLAAAFVAAVTSVLRADDWPQWMGPDRDGNWREAGILEKFPDGGPQVLWRKPLAYGFAGPAVAEGRVYVTDYRTDARIREISNPGARPPVDGRERVWCFDAKTGKELWKYEYECHYEISYPGGPRCTPTVHQGKVYTLGAMGHLHCLDARSGQPLWSKDFQRDLGAQAPIWGFAGHPLVEGKQLICLVGGKDGIVYSFDKDSGKELWHALDAPEPGYSPPTIIEAGGARQLLIWHSESINSLNPSTGKVYWSIELKPSNGMAIMAPRKFGEYLFAGARVNQSAVFRLAADNPAATLVYRGTPKTSLYAINATPFIDNGIIYGPDHPGPFRAVKLETGERLWETNQPISGPGGASRGSGTAFVIKNGDRFFLASESGDLIIAKLSPEKYEEISRWKMLEPTSFGFDRNVVWSHPAFADKCVFARNDAEIICASLAAP